MCRDIRTNGKKKKEKENKTIKMVKKKNEK